MAAVTEPRELTAGRELDVLVAEKVMGLVRCQGKKHNHSFPSTYCFAQPDSPTQGGELRNYSNRMEDAWLIVFKAQLEKRMVSLNWLPEADEWACRIYPSDYSTSGEEACSKNPCEAICLAALKAVQP